MKTKTKTKKPGKNGTNRTDGTNPAGVMRLLGVLLTVEDIMWLVDRHPEKFALALLRREQKKLSEAVLPVTQGK